MNTSPEEILMSEPEKFVIGVDAGTGSVRAGVFNLSGNMLGYGCTNIAIWRPAPDFVEQSSENIWKSACIAVRTAIKNAGIKKEAVTGIAFDATCSLAALDAEDNPITVSPTGRNEQNIIVWMDHRAKNEAAFINKTKHTVLKYVGGKMSPEQEPPKLLWLKKNLPGPFKKTVKFMDLADYLTCRATGIDARSLCTVVCKWGYLGHKGKNGSWDRNFYSRIGLAELLDQNKIGTDIRPMGTPIGPLTERSAQELGLPQDTIAGAGIIDAHAGGIGVAGIPLKKNPGFSFENVLSLIGGTSTCHMAVSKKPVFVPGVWGPYYSAMLPGMWLTEGGQSATGSLIDFILQTNSLYGKAVSDARTNGQTLFEYLNKRLEALLKKDRFLTKNLHILPYFHGNRSPRANPDAKGCISGLTLNNDIDSYATLYLAALQAIAYGTRHIIEEMNRHGHRIKAIASCGGLTKNRYFLKEHANITGCAIYIPSEEEAVLSGTAMLAARATGAFASVQEACRKMSSAKSVIKPDKSCAEFHERKYKIFKLMYEHQTVYESC